MRSPGAAAAMSRSRRGAGIAGAVDGVAEAHDPPAGRQLGLHPGLGAGRVADGVERGLRARPPRAAVAGGPASAPRAAPTTSAMSAPVEATTRAVNVEALKPWSIVSIRYCSSAWAARGVGISPVTRRR